ncbi:MAG TPA: lysylphosphatidylglycerol synthase transmembrane domain-containing protein [Bacteroidales bacterium]|nr:lysylphosphatidylglycerol synthase transmembrane domain-containing protein [Bacteroidales bacterium]
MKKTLIRILQFTVFLALTVFLMYLVMKGIDFKRILADLKSANYFWVVVSVFIGLVAFVARAYRWNLLIEPLGHKPSLTNSYHAVAIGYIANIALPRLGEFSKCVSLNRTNRIPIDSLVGTILIERAIDMVTLLFLLLVIFIGKFESFGKFISEKIFVPLGAKFANLFHESSQLLIIIGASFVLLIVLSYIFRHQLAKIHLYRKIRKIVTGILGGLKTVYKMRKRLQFLAATFVIWLCYFLMTYLIFFTIPETSHLTPIDGLFILVIGSFGMVIPVQGGFGAFHGMIILGLSLYGITLDKAFVYAVLSHESQTLMAIVAGSISLIKVFSSHSKKKLITSK